MKMKTKGVALLLVIVLALVSVQSGLAAEEWNRYILDEVEMSVSIPNELGVFTRNMPADSQVLLDYGLSSEMIDALLLSKNGYLFVMTPDGSKEIDFYITKTTLGNFSMYSDNVIYSVKSQIIEQMEKSTNGTVDKFEIYHSGPVTYIYLVGHANDYSLYFAKYGTVHDYKNLSIEMYSFIEPLTNEDEKLFRDIIDSIAFGENISVPNISQKEMPSDERTVREYVLPEGPIVVELDDSRYNILMPGMDLSEPAVVRSGIPLDRYEAYMNLKNVALIMFDIDEQLPDTFTISIRIKDNKYEGLDLRECSESEVAYVLDSVYSGFAGSSSQKEIVEINGVPYLKFKWMNGTELRYATIVNGDMIYIWATREEGNMTAEDEALLLQVVEAVKYQR